MQDQHRKEGVATVNGFIVATVNNMEKKGNNSWSRGRTVIIRPDASGNFDPAASRLLTDDGMRQLIAVALDAHYDEVQAESSDPDWYRSMQGEPPATEE